MAVYYGLSSRASSLPNAGNLTSTGGGATTTQTAGTQTFNYGSFIELFFTGGVSSVGGAIGSANGRGFLLDTAELHGQTIPAGVWTVQIPLVNSDSSATVNLTARIFRCDPNALTFTEIGEATLAAQTVDTTLRTFTFSISAAQTVFGATETLYLDCWYNLTFGGSATNLTAFGVSSTTAGVDTSLKITTPSTAAVPHALQVAFSEITRLLATFAVSRWSFAFSESTRLLATFSRGSPMAQPNSLIDVTSTVTENGSPATLTTVSVVVTFPDGTTTTYGIGTGVTSLGGGQYKLTYTTKAPGPHKELWSLTASDGSVAQYLNVTGVSF